MSHLLLALLSVFAFASLALAMRRHQEDVSGRFLSCRSTRFLRISGWASLLVALVVAVHSQGWSFGLVSYSGHTSLGAGIVFIALMIWSRIRQTIRRAKDRLSNH